MKNMSVIKKMLKSLIVGDSQKTVAHLTELRIAFDSFEAWMAFNQAEPFIRDPEWIEELAGRVREDGFVCPFHDSEVPAKLVRSKEAPYREGFVHKGLNSRLRAVVFELNRAVAERGEQASRIYAPEAVTQFALLLRGRYPKFVGSEYSEDPKVVGELFPILCEDLLDLSFPDGAFDAVVVNDVFEHVPSIDRCLSEIARVTMPGGRLITTFPFSMGSEVSAVKARLGVKGVEFLSKPEYHGNPVDPQGSLVFEIPGWDILDRARAAGWSKVEMVYHQSLRYGILSNGFSGVFTMVAVR